MNNEADMADFNGTQVNFAEEYHAARKLMGTKGTNLEDLSYNTGLLLVNAPEKWVEPYQNLIREIEQRAIMLQNIAIDKLFAKL